MMDITIAMELMANQILTQNATAKGNEAKPNFTNRDFMNATIIFQHALMDKAYDLMTEEQLHIDDQISMAEACGQELRRLIKTYTGLDTHDVENFV